MKGVVFSTSFFILIFSLFFCLSHYVHFEHHRAIINNKFKKSITELAYRLQEKEDFLIEDVLDEFEHLIKNDLSKDYKYDVRLMGFYDSPLLIRIEMDCVSLKTPFSFTLEETVIEKEMIKVE